MIVGTVPTRVNAIRDALATARSLPRIPQFADFCKFLRNRRFHPGLEQITSKESSPA